MRRLLFALALIAPTAAVAFPGDSTTPLAVAPYGYRLALKADGTTAAQHGLSVASATSLTLPPGATYATICARGGIVTYTTDGTTTPTASVGTPLSVGACVGMTSPLLTTFSAIGASATLDVEYFK